ncbi:MAG TPA: RNA degradosome polyphosphate kinase [Lachnospiraceae bacterium]|nr:RNA degradosome polyphosphate kinase [Lachnospiraceae bacterium]
MKNHVKAKTAEKTKSAEKTGSIEKPKNVEKGKTASGTKAAEAAGKPEENLGFYNPSYYTNRELSWLDFNYRILDEARDKTNPLFERLKFLSITASNLDEFFMVRVASLMDMVHAKVTKPDLSGLTPSKQLEQVEAKCHELIDRQYSTLSRSLLPALRNEGYDLVMNLEELSEAQRDYLKTYFEGTVYPVLTPTAVDASRPFPLIRNKSLNIGALISRRKGEGEKNSVGMTFMKNLQKNGEKIADKISRDKTLKKGTMFATVQVPTVLPRVIRIPSAEEGQMAGVLLEDLIKANLSRLFTGYDVVCAHAYRITRNADMTLDEDDSDDLLEEIQSKLKQRQWGEVIRFEYEDSMDPKLLKILKREFNVNDSEMYPISGPLDLTYLMKMYSLPGSDRLKEKPWTPQPNPVRKQYGDLDLFSVIRKGDLFLSHPYQTFDPVVNLIRDASVDPDVLAIKITLYRVSGHSPIVAALAHAAENGKQVTALVELKARFDEENNIQWAEMLEKAGCHVIYGLVGLKTHSKIALVVRREDDGIRRYVHLATGNYNDSTAKLYTDCGIMTCAEPFGEDATAVFNMLSGYSEPRKWNRLHLAPIWLRDAFVMLIDREIRHAQENEPAHITAKMNSLCDREIIAKLYEASAAGVKIDLIIRGICCLRVGIPGVSENITVRSIVGTFLEHARIFRFANGGREEVYMASADWMPRNLDRRVEILFPLEDPLCREQACHILDVQMADTLKAHVLQSDNTYEKVDRRGKVSIGAQATLMEEALAASADLNDPRVSRTFQPAHKASE